MIKNKLPCAIAFSLASALTLASAISVEAQQSETSWDDKLASLAQEGLLSNPSTQCVPLAQPQKAKNPALAERASSIVGTLKKTKLTEKLVIDFAKTGGVLCFSDFSKSRLSSMIEGAGALYEDKHNTIILNNSFSEGCHVALGIHEMQHSRQRNAGLATPASNLKDNDLRELVTAKEADANVIQFLSAWKLANPTNGSEPYTEAFSCLRDLSNQVSYKRDMALIVEKIAHQNPEWIDNGNAARILYDRIHNDEDFQRIYTRGLTSQVRCENGECDTTLHDLKHFGIDLARLGEIHFPRDYRQLPMPKVP